MRILLTGGCGFIGTHTALALVAAGHEPILLDNFSNSSPAVVDRLNKIARRPLSTVTGDIRDVTLVRSVLAAQQIDAVIHFAALKSVADSVADPLSYYANNVGGMLALIEAMQAEEVREIVLSSSATVYGEPVRLPIDEEHPTQAVNPYGRTKLHCEDILSDVANADRDWRVSILRYFNPVGAHPSGLIGEDASGPPSNLMPLVTRVANGQMANLLVYGSDYPTADGTAVRDYVHVMDLADGHVAAIEALHLGKPLQIYNLGTGRGTSVLDLVRAFETSNDIKVPFVTADRRPGDVAKLYACVNKAARELQWSATRSLSEMCIDSWRFARRSG